MEKEEESSDGSSSSASSTADHYGVITEDHSKATTMSKKNKSDSAYAVFNEQNGKKH